MLASRRRPVHVVLPMPQPFPSVVAVLRQDRHGVVADGHTGDGRRRIVLRPGPAAQVRYSVDVHVGPLIEDGDAIGVPLWWEAARHRAWFPTLDAGLEAAPGPGGTELRLTGSYLPPLGGVGSYGDGLLGHRLALACLEHFLEQVAGRIASRIPAPDRGP